MLITIYVASAILGVLFRYNLGMTQSCKIIGVALSDSDSATGFQDAITPPSSTNRTLITWVLIIGLLIATAYEFGWESFGISIAIFLITSIIAGAVILPKPDSKHYAVRMFTSLKERHSKFEQSGDLVRAKATKEIIDKFEERLGEQVG